MSSENPSRRAGSGRALGIPGFLALVVAYLAIIKLGGLVFATAIDDGGAGDLYTTQQLAFGLLAPIGLSLLFVYAVVGVLGWWRPVFVDERPVQRWVIVVPIVLVLSILAAINWGGLADKPAGFVLVLVLAAVCVGFAEEGMFRGLGVTVFRASGFPEAKVALWSSVVFGAAHLSNALTSGGAAVAQAIVVSFAGYFFYLVRRRTGGLIVGAVLHGMFDFSLLSGAIVKGQTYAGSAAAILAYVVLAVVLLARRHRIEPTTEPSPPTLAAAAS